MKILNYKTYENFRFSSMGKVLSYEASRLSTNTLLLSFNRRLTTEQLDQILNNIIKILDDKNITVNKSVSGSKLILLLSKVGSSNNINIERLGIDEIELKFDMNESDALIDKLLKTKKGDILPTFKLSIIVIVLLSIVPLMVIIFIIVFLVNKYRTKKNKK